ncbi:MAG: CHAT domain-containing protein [Xenococcaceae cyanobacterium]
MISLIIVNYNRERYLKKAIASILEQTRIDWELLIWDDGSTDNSVEIAREYEQQDDRIKVIAATHQGVAKARKQAIDATTGDYIGWVDSDDWIADTALAETARVLDSNLGVGMVYTDYYDVNSRGKILGKGKRCNIPYSPQRLLVDFMTFHFRLIRREVYEKIGGINTNCEYAYDYDLCLRLSEVTKFKRISKVLYYYRYHGKNISYRQRKEQIQSSQQAINQALQRRGLADTYILKVEGDRFYLRKKETKVFAQLWGEEIAKFTNLGELRGRQDSIFAPLAPQRWGEEKEKSPEVGGFRGRNFLKTAATLIATLPFTAAIAFQPASAQQIIPNNDGTMTVITKDGNTFNIDGGTLSGDGKNLFHSFQEFGLDAGEIVNFLSNPNIQNILGRINGGNPSMINGLIQVTGGNSNLFLMNPSGIIFGNNASLNVPGDFTATTATGIGFGNGWFNAVGTNDYLNLVGNPNSFNFANSESGIIINAGDLKAADDSNISLTGGTVINTGTIETEGGNITVAAVPGTNRIRISQEGQLLSIEIAVPQDENGQPLAIRAIDLPNLLRGLPVDVDTGLEVAANDDVTVVNSNTVIPNELGTNIVSGTVDVSNTDGVGGEAHLLGDKVGLIDANVDAFGNNGGGEVLVGGDYKGEGTVPNADVTLVDSNSEIKADALQNGDGGKVIVWADETTGFYGNISARGGNIIGDGGFVEVSGKQNLIFNGAVDTFAPNGNLGELLLDPTNIEIVGSGYGSGYGNTTTNLGDVDEFSDPDLDPTNSITRIENTAINNATSNVTLQANNDITFSQPVNITNAGVGLTAQANNNINVNANITTTGGNVTLTGDADSNGSGRVEVNNPISTTGGDINISGNSADDAGVLILEDINSGTGNIVISGTGDLQDGVNITGAQLTASENGTITITGNSAGDIGVETLGGQIASENGNITITGNSTSVGNVSGSVGVNTQGTIVGSSNGAIAISGTTDTVGATALELTGAISTSNDVTLTGDDMNFAIVAGDNVTLQPESAVTDINIAPTQNIEGNLNISQTELSNISEDANTIIGREDSNGTITVANDIELNNNLTLRSPETNGDIVVDGEIITGGNNLIIDASTGININRNIDTDGGVISLTSSGTIDTTNASLISSSDERSGGNITITATGDIQTGEIDSSVFGNSPQTNTAGDITITSDGGAISATGEIIAGGETGDGGDITLSAQNNIQILSAISSSQAGSGGNITITSNTGSINTTQTVPNPNNPTSTSSFGLLLSGAGNQGQNGGNISLTAPGDITTGFIYSGSLGNGVGGTISLESTGGNINTTIGANEQLIQLSSVNDNLPEDLSETIREQIFAGVSSFSQNNSGDITFTANNGNITASNINASSITNTATEAIAVRLTTLNDIETGYIDSSGEINIDTEGLFTATATIPETDISIRGTNIAIEHGGGNTNPITPFIVGDAATNGTAGAIVTSENLNALTSLPNSFTSENATIQILTSDDPPIVAANDGTGSVVTAQTGNEVVYNITGGTTSGDEENLFHSFTRFDLPESDQTANFVVNNSLNNILARVTSGDASDIRGTIQVTGGTPNLFLINPAGIIFGSTAQLNVPAAFTATTGNGVGFGDNWFSASGAYDASVLNGTPDTVALTSNNPGTIINNANLTNNNGALNFIGGTVVISGDINSNGFSAVALNEGESIVAFSDFSITSTEGVTNLPNTFESDIATFSDLEDLVSEDIAVNPTNPDDTGLEVQNPLNSNGRDINLIGNSNNAQGVRIDTIVNAAGGNINITGTSVAEDGVFIRGQVVTSDNGVINVTGTSTEDIGILILGDNVSEEIDPTEITTGNGAINLTGTTLSETSLGISTQNTDIDSINGAIDLTGNSNGTGIQTENTQVITAVDANSPETKITLTADTMDLDIVDNTEGDGSSFTSNELILQPVDPSRNINLETNPDTPPADALNFANGEINELSEDVNLVTIGREDSSGTIAVTDDFNDGLVVESSLTLRTRETNGAIAINDEIITSGNNLNLDAGTSVNINGDITTDGGAIDITSGGTINTSQSTLDSNADDRSGGNITFSATGNITTGAIDSTSDSTNTEDKGGDITITSSGGDIFAVSQSGITSSGENGDGGNVDLSAAGNIQTSTIISGSAEGNGGDITLESTGGDINTTLEVPSENGETINFGAILSGSEALDGGNIRLTAPGNITTGFIYSGSLGTGEGGTINIESTGGNINTAIGATEALLLGSSIAEDLPPNLPEEIFDSIFAGVSSFSQNNAGDITITANNGNITTSNINAASLTTTGGEVTLNTTSGTIAPQNITTTNNNVTLNGAVTLAQDTTIANGTGDVNFTNTVNDDRALTINSTGNTTFNGAVGGDTPLSSLSTDAGGTTQLNANVTTTGNQTYNDGVTLGNDITLQGTNITTNTVDGDRALTINSTGNTTFNGAVGGDTPLSSLTTDANGTTQLNANITTTGNQTYIANEVDIATGVNITGDTVTLQPHDSAADTAIAPNTQSENTLDITQAELDTIEANAIAIGNSENTTGTITVEDLVTVDDPLTLNTSDTIQVNGEIIGTDNASITLNSSQTNLNSNITTEGNNLTINSDVTLQDDVVLDTSPNEETEADINITGSVNGANDLTLDAGSGNVIVRGTIGTTETPLEELEANSTGTTSFEGAINAASVTTNAGGTTNINGNVTTTGDQTFNDNVTISTDTGNDNDSNTATLNSTDGNITTQNITTSGNPLNITADVISTQNINTQGGNVELESREGEITTGDIDSSGTTGGNITLNSATTINTAAINSSSSTGNGGNVILNSGDNANVRVGSIRADGNNNNGGEIKINANSENPGLFVANDFIDKSELSEVSIFTNSSNEGAIIIKHGGRGIIPFEVDNPDLEERDNPNGTVGKIIGGNSQIDDESFLFTEIRDNIGIISVDADEEDEEEIARVLNSPQDKTGDLIDSNSDNNFTGQPSLKIASIPEARKTLMKIAEQAAQKPALVYINFTSSEIQTGTNNTEEYFERAENCLTAEYKNGLNLEENLVTPTVCLAAQPTDKLEILVVTPEGEPIYFQSNVTREEVEEQAEELYIEVADAEIGWRQPARQLYQWLIAGIEEELVAREIDNLLFVLPPKLRSLPLAALQDGATEQFLVQKGFNVGLAPSINLMNTIYDKNIQDAAVLALGASDFTEDQQQVPLNAVEVELKEIVELKGGNTPIINEEFTLENLQNTLDDNNQSIVHFATHANFDTETIDNIYIQLYDRKLSLEELKTLNIKVGGSERELLVLSACRSAFGNVDAELGFAGLAVKLGFKTAIGSLWYVEDVTNPGLMIEFYHHLKTNPFKAEALRLAQLAMIEGRINIDLQNRQMITSWGEVIELPEAAVATLKDKGITKINLSHPYYWAPFTVIGSPW